MPERRASSVYPETGVSMNQLWLIRRRDVAAPDAVPWHAADDSPWTTRSRRKVIAFQGARASVRFAEGRPGRLEPCRRGDDHVARRRRRISDGARDLGSLRGAERTRRRPRSSGRHGVDPAIHAWHGHGLVEEHRRGRARELRRRGSGERRCSRGCARAVSRSAACRARRASRQSVVAFVTPTSSAWRATSGGGRASRPLGVERVVGTIVLASGVHVSISGHRAGAIGAATDVPAAKPQLPRQTVDYGNAMLARCS
jgi:hypothetical protein